MDRDVNLQIEELRQNIVKMANQSGLPIGVVYYVMKDIMVDLENSYNNYVNQAYKKEREAQAAAAQKEAEMSSED